MFIAQSWRLKSIIELWWMLIFSRSWNLNFRSFSNQFCFILCKTHYVDHIIVKKHLNTMDANFLKIIRVFSNFVLTKWKMHYVDHSILFTLTNNDWLQKLRNNAMSFYQKLFRKEKELRTTTNSLPRLTIVGKGFFSCPEQLNSWPCPLVALSVWPN